MKRVSVREGNLPEKIKHIVLSPLVKKNINKPAEVYECNDPAEILDILNKSNAQAHTLRPFEDKKSGKGDSRWYFLAIVLEEKTEAGLIMEVNKVYFAEASPAWLRNEAKKVLERKKEEKEKRWQNHIIH